ncbi:MAG: zinc ribbon domain-containing protein, partial [Lachnospiraceae bacterium]|nr:zinc ribbon domain-containing protein [Lachnospiraceae bacterium]
MEDVGKLTIQDYALFKGNGYVEYALENRDTMQKFTFCLAAAAANFPGERSDHELKDSIEGAYIYGMATSIFLAIEGRTGWSIKTMDKEAARAAFHGAMELEFFFEPREFGGRVYQLHPTVQAQLIANRDAFFDQVWDAALIMYDSIKAEGNTTLVNHLNGIQDPANPMNFIITVDCHQQDSLWNNYYSKLKATAPAGCQKIASSYDAATGIGTIVFQVPAGTSADALAFEFEDSSHLTDLSKPVLYQLNFCEANNNGEAGWNCGNWQTLFCAMHEVPTYKITTKRGGGGGGGGGGSVASIELEMHRYRHTETWQSTYNVDLLKFDAETGKPLEGSKWDILEYDMLGQWNEAGTQLGESYLDHPISEASSIGTKYNWANDNGSQFIRWEDEDTCDRDVNITGPDGYLYETNTVENITNTKAHTDVYHYTYTKGYCTGHPKPVVHYYECNHDPEDNCDCEEKNAELDHIAEEAYQEQLAYCEKLAEEGGFFHTAAESISDEAKKQMETDRDEFYKDYISLTYDYSAKETAARNGYILHGKHTDDIPIERVVIHSSEYLDEIAGGGRLNSGVISRQEKEIRGPENNQDEHTDKALTLNTIKNPDTHNQLNLEHLTKSATPSTAAKLKKSLNTVPNVKKAASIKDKVNTDTASHSNTTTKPNALEDPTNLAFDIELLDEPKMASVSDAGRPERKSILNIFWGNAVSFFHPSGGNFHVKGAVRTADEENESGAGGYARDNPEPPKHGAPVIYTGVINFEDSEATPHSQGKSDIVCWTFTVFDHRTEGEIHFNKRDLNLSSKENTLFDAYMQENADGTLEGAVYGLFALQDILHPDSQQSEETPQDTGLVYQAGDLVAVATTDRNGDGSFMVYTEAPGMTYDDESGAIVARTDKAWEGPSNLHKKKDEADNGIEDNEKFYGWDSEGQNEVILNDSMTGDNTFYWKHSSNQGKNKGKDQDDGAMYPISDNEGNNGNCWIGRPLIVSGKNAASYYIKELSRSEGYELSVYGKDMSLTNREAPEEGSMVVEGVVSMGTMQVIHKDEEDGNGAENDLTITATDTTNGFDVTFKDLESTGEGAQFFLTESRLVQKEVPVYELVKKRYPVMAKAGEVVLINGKRVEAQLGDEISLPNKTTATVKNTVTDSGNKFYLPKNQIALALPNAQRYADAAGNNFMEKYNAALHAKRFSVPPANAPWLLVPKGNSEAESFTMMTESLHSYTGFDQMRIAADLGNIYAVQYAHSMNPESIYDLNNQILWVKKEAVLDGGEGFLYAGYPADKLSHNGTGFLLNNQKPDRNRFSKYEDLSSIAFHDASGETYWAYADGEQALESNGEPAFFEKLEEVQTGTTKAEVSEDVLTELEVVYDMASNTYTLHFDEPGTYRLRIRYSQEMEGNITTAEYARQHAIINHSIAAKTAGTYMEEVQLAYPGQGEVRQDAGSIQAPTRVFERPIRQKVRIEKDIQTLPETKVVWYCINCGYENPDGTAACGFCGRARSTEETKTIAYAHDTYAAVHSDNISAERDGGWYETAKDWLGNLLKGNSPEEEPESIGNFRFKAYLKSNLERLYRNEEGHILWMDQNGNTMTPQYEDTNGDGNYDTFIWKYDEVYDGKTVDFPEKDKISGGEAGEGSDPAAGIIAEDAILLSSNVQKIYTDVEHRTESMTTSARANNVWNTYADPQEGIRENAGQIEGYTTSERENRPEGDAVITNASLYSYDGILRDRNRSDYLQDEQNHGYTRLLETQRIAIEDGTELIRHEAYNYEKFFDAIQAANTDIWDNDMHSTFTGTSMTNYPGQHWLKTFYEKYQPDDTDRDHTLANTDGQDKDNTAGGDRNTSFKPFRWIREHVFGDREGYIQYPAVNNGENTEIIVNTSDQARANANASDAVRQFAVKWYLEDEAAKLMVDNGLGENIAKPDGKIGYDEAVYDLALFEAIAKAYDYLRPFYNYDLDTIYSVEWDSAAGGGADKDYTTLSADERLDNRYYNISSYLPYGVYVIVEQPPQRRDDAVNDWKNRSFSIEKPKEVIVPSVYEEAE